MTRILNSRDDLLPIGTEFERTSTVGMETTGPIVRRRIHWRVVDHRLAQTTRSGDVCKWVEITEPLWKVEQPVDEMEALGIQAV